MMRELVVVNRRVLAAGGDPCGVRDVARGPAGCTATLRTKGDWRELTYGRRVMNSSSVARGSWGTDGLISLREKVRLVVLSSGFSSQLIACVNS